ncbi:4Fe-4S dicluster-binding protein [Anoxynatronum buryatiense]|uniref:4Fe-4S dicluster domain-containing protein n=1 Tax=Anoxynatronum buryatiense TaxID=489973 RepID=A0AA45WVU8_9CLOT|nr:4Fe-4S dicluster-binding protein [Anoxynatronum buryatiense]SMP53862.1 4Fe-4S dicluster domain-containing protein [Anoxynatronum buryatiense]
MYIDQEKCIGCQKCLNYCPVAAIEYSGRSKDQKAYAFINRDECVECAVCYRARVCPTDAFVQEALDWPRILRSAFSDPFNPHKGTNVPGRGTEEMKTTDITNRFPEGTIGIGLEFGRPGIGLRLKETEPVIRRLLESGIKLEPCNPLTELITDENTGQLKTDAANEKVLSAIVEFIAPLEQAEEVFDIIREAAQATETVFSLDIVGKVSADGSIPVMQEVEKAGLRVAPNGKVNVGLGRMVAK